MNITEDYVNFEIAKLLKEKGFNELCFRLIREDGDIIEVPSQAWNGLTKKQKADFYLCPTLQMACKWLREVHKIFIYIEPFITTSGLQGYKPYCTKIGGEFMWINPLRKYSNTSSDTYEEAVEAALKYSLEIMI